MTFLVYLLRVSCTEGQLLYPNADLVSYINTMAVALILPAGIMLFNSSELNLKFECSYKKLECYLCESGISSMRGIVRE